MDDLFEDSESEPHHFIVLDSQDTENIPPSWDDTSILKSLPALQIPETQFSFELTTIPATPLSPIHNILVSETHLFDSDLVDSCNFNQLKIKRDIMDDQRIVDETCSQSSSTSDSSGNFARSLNQSMMENPKFDAKAKSSSSSTSDKEKTLNIKEYEDSTGAKINIIPSTSYHQKVSKETDLTMLARQSLFKSDHEDTESDEKEPNPVVSTPSTVIGSLHFSQESMLVPDTADEMNYIEPSPEHNPTPIIIPDSPTLCMTQESDDDTQDPTMIETSFLKQKESENLDATVEPYAEDSVRDSQNFQLLFLETQTSEVSQVERCVSQMSQLGRHVSQVSQVGKHVSQMSQVERRVSPEKSINKDVPKTEAENSDHDNSMIVSESQDLNLHISFNTQTQSSKDAASQRSSFSGKTCISQSPATPKDNSSEEVKFKLILPSSAPLPNKISKCEIPKTHSEGSLSTCLKSNFPKTLDTSQGVSQGKSTVQYKIKSQDKVVDPDIPHSQEGRPEMIGSQKRDTTIGSQGVQSGSQKRDPLAGSQKDYSQKVIPSSQKEDLPAGSQQEYSQSMARGSQKGESSAGSQKGYLQSSQKGDSPAGSQKEYSQNVDPSSQKGYSVAGSQKDNSQRVIPSSQKEDFPAGSQKDNSQLMARSSQKVDSPAGSQRSYSQSMTHGSQKGDAGAGSQKGYSQNVDPSSQKMDSPGGSQKDNSQKVIPSSWKEDFPAGSQKDNSQIMARGSQKAGTAGSQKGYSQSMACSSQKVDSQKGHSQNVDHSSQKLDSPAGSQKVIPSSQKDFPAGSQKDNSQSMAHFSQKGGSLAGSQRGYSQSMTHGSQKGDVCAGSQKDYSQYVDPSSQKEDFPAGSQKDNSQIMARSSQKQGTAGSQKDYSQSMARSSQKVDSPVGSQKGHSQNVNPSSQKEHSLAGSQKDYSQRVIPSSQKEDFPAGSQKEGSQRMARSSQKVDSPAGSQKGYSQNPSSQKMDSSVLSQKRYSQNVDPSSQKGDAASQKGYSQSMAHTSQKGGSAGSQRGYSQSTALGSQKVESPAGSQKDSQNAYIRDSQSDFHKRSSQNTPTSSQQEPFHGMTPTSHKEEDPATISGSQEGEFKTLDSQSQNVLQMEIESSEVILLGSQKEGMNIKEALKIGETSFDTGLNKRDSQDVTLGSQKEKVGSQRESSLALDASQMSDSQTKLVVKQKEETSQDILPDLQKMNTQDMPSNSQKKDSQEMPTLSQKQQLQGSPSNSQKRNSQSFAQRKQSQTGSQHSSSQGVSKSQKEDSEIIDLSDEFQEKHSQSSVLGKGNTQDISVGSLKSSQSLSGKEKSLDMSVHSQKDDSQCTLPGSQKNDTLASQGNSYTQPESQSHIVPPGSQKENTPDLCTGSQKARSQPAMSNISQGADIPSRLKTNSQSRISSMDPSNVLVTQISTDSPNKDKKSLGSGSQKLSHSQPSDPNVSRSNLHDSKQYSSSLDSGLPHLTNVEPLVPQPKKADSVSEISSPTDKATEDPSNPLMATEDQASAESQNPKKESPEKLTAIPLGPVSNFQFVGSLPKPRGYCANEPAVFSSQEKQGGTKKEFISSSQPSILKRKYSDICKKNISEETLPSSSSSVRFENQEQKRLKPIMSHEHSSLKTLPFSDIESQESEKNSLNKESSFPEKIDIDFASIQLPSKPNVCYLKESQHSQGSSTITLSQNHQFPIFSSQMDVSQELNKNSMDDSHPSTHDNKNLGLAANPECSKILTTSAKNLTVIKPKGKRVMPEIPEASSTMYPSQTSASQQRRSPSVEIQPQQADTSNVARYNVGSVKPDMKTEGSLVGSNNDPYLFVGSQPKAIQTVVESRKKQRRSKVVSKFTQKRIQKKSLPKKKSSLSGRSWTIRKDYKSPVHRVRFEPLRRRTASAKLLKDDPIFLKVPSYKDIETIFSKKDKLKEQVKSSCSSDASTQPSTTKDQALFSNLQNVLQRKIVEETVVQLVYRKTTIETVKNSKVVDSRTIVEKDEPLIIQSNRSEDFKYLNSAKGVSPFCSPNSLTSGEYADVSSLSHSDSKTSNSSSFGSLNTKSSRFGVPPMSPLVRQSSSQSKKDILSGSQGRQPVTSRQLQSPGTDDDLLKVPSPITSIYKDAHAVYCSTDELHTVNQSCEDGRSYVTETVPNLEASSGDPVKSRATVVQNSDSLFSSTENLNISDSGPSVSVTVQETVIGKEGQGSGDSLVHEADQSITLHVESAETSLTDLKTPPASQKWTSPQKRKASLGEENSEESSIEKPPAQKRLRKDSRERSSLQPTKTSEECGSPEISQQNYQQQIKMPSLSPSSSKKAKSGIGVKVMAKWKDGYFYPGVTASLEKSGKCLINFADGDELWVKLNQILIVNHLPQGQSVMVQSKDNFFDSGMIVDHIDNDSDSADSFLYQIEMDDNTTVTCTRQQVILSEDQAAILLSDDEYQMTSIVPSTPQPSGADVSLDNLVEGSRRSTKKLEVSSEKSRSSKRTKLMKMEPQAMSTPTPKRKTKSLKKESKDPDRFIGAAVSSPKSQRYGKIPHVKKELFDAVKGPIPKQKNLFKGMNFLLTHTEKSQEQKLLDKKMIQDISSESSPNQYYSDMDEPEIPFDKQHLQSQIEAGGGTVFDSWSDKFLTKNKSFIISSSYQRTIKYIQGLAAGIPCVSYLWIRDCCKQGISADYKSYMLPAGISLKKKSLIECKLKSQCLDDTQVLVYSTSPDFVSTWSEILTLAGCNVVKKFKKTRDQNRELDIVITDKTCSAHIKKQAEIYNTPLLSTEWVIQCLIYGQKLCYTSHEKYKFDYEEEK